MQSRVEPGWVRAQLPASPPEQPEAFAAVLADLDRVVVPGVTHWQHPGLARLLPDGRLGPVGAGRPRVVRAGRAGDALVDVPACTELETHVLDWMAELLGLPERFRSDGDGRRRDRGVGLRGDPVRAAGRPLAARPGDGPFDHLRAYTSTQAHSSIEKAVRIAGLRPDQLRLVDVDDALRRAARRARAPRWPRTGPPG